MVSKTKHVARQHMLLTFLHGPSHGTTHHRSATVLYIHMEEATYVVCIRGYILYGEGVFCMKRACQVQRGSDLYE